MEPVQEWARMRGAGGPDTTAAPGNPRSRALAVAGVVLALGMLVASAVVGWVFLERYHDPDATAPAGSDTAHHHGASRWSRTRGSPHCLRWMHVRRR